MKNNNKSLIRILTDHDFDDFLEIVRNAYPSIKVVTREDRNNFKDRTLNLQKKDTDTKFYGLFRNKKMMGTMRLHNFTMNLFGTRISVGGIGLIAVHLLHKKEKVCKGIMTFTQRHFEEKGKKMILLYPFRPDFYKKMGYGYGTKVNQYRIKPADLPKGESKANVKFLKGDDVKLLIDCHNRYAVKTNGLLMKTFLERRLVLNRPNIKVIGYKKNNKIYGYMIFSFKSAKQDNFVMNDIHVIEFVYENKDALLELITFLHSQADQINRVIFNTQDEDFHFLFADPRNGTDNLIPSAYHETNVQGIGIMYKIIDIKGLFRALRKHNFNDVDCMVRVNVTDPFPKIKKHQVTIKFKKGIPVIVNTNNHDVEISLGIAEFSSLFMGTVSYRSLHKYGLSNISNQRYLDTVNKVFAATEKPICFTAF